MDSSDDSGDMASRIRTEVAIADVVGEFLDLGVRGTCFIAICPWHEETPPVLQIDPQRSSLAVGFRTRNNMADMALWADPQTARLVRVEFDRFGGDGHAVMSNFHYDMELDPSLFSLEPPAGYTVQTQTVTKPVEEDRDRQVPRHLRRLQR